MPRDSTTIGRPIVLVHGEDEFAVKQRALQVFGDWCREGQSIDSERIDAAAGNTAEALASLSRLREALQTLPFFGEKKVVWFQNCSFLGEERAASSQPVVENLAALAQELKQMPWENERLLITAGKVDKRKAFYKALEKLATVETFSGWSLDDRDWTAGAEESVQRHLRSLSKEISPEALSKLVVSVGPNSRMLHSETEKLATYVGSCGTVSVQDVDAIVTRNKQGRAFALAEALGDRNLPKLLRTLDEELWEAKRDSQKSGIGLLYAVISKVRLLIFLKEMTRAGWIKADADYPRFKQQLERVPPDALPSDRRFNPLLMNPYGLYKSLGQAKRYTLEELIQAMETLLECNQQLIFSSQDQALALQRSFAKIVSGAQQSRLA